MTLEARVEALERDVAALRVETRGWATFAISADKKTIAAGELISLLHQDISDIKAELSEILNQHTQILGEHGDMLREILNRLS